MKTLLVLTLSISSVMARAQCARTPELATLGLTATTEQLGASGGYRVESVKRDLVGQGRWAVVRACAHPEWPAYMVPAPSSLVAPAVAVQKQSAELAVRAGERVFVRQRSAASRMQLAAIATRSGTVGDVIPVTMAAFGSDGAMRRVDVVIKGKGEVELR